MRIHVQLNKRPLTRNGRTDRYWTIRWRDSHGRMKSKSLGLADEMLRRDVENIRRKFEDDLNAGREKRDTAQSIRLSKWKAMDVAACTGGHKTSSVYEVGLALRHSQCRLNRPSICQLGLKLL